MAQDIQSLLPGALRLIAEQNKLTDPQPAGWVADRVPSTGAVIYRVYATPKDKPNGPIYTVTIDDQGKPVDTKTLAAREKVELFPPFPRAGAEALNPEPKVRVAAVPERASFVTAEATLAAGGPAAAAAVTINPSVNDLKLMPGQVFTEDIHVIVPPTPDPLFDVYFLADTTGSMFSIIDAVKAGAGTIMNTLRVQFPNMAFGVGNYKDFASVPPDPFCFQHQLSPTVNPLPVQTAINTWAANGGDDLPEGQFFALNQIATQASIGWRPGAKRILVWFGDAPGHDPICAGLPGVPTAITEAIVKNNLAVNGIKVLAISTVTGFPLGLDDTPFQGNYPCANTGTAGQGTRIATATGGSYTSGVNAATISATIVSAVTAAATLFNNIKLVPTGATAPFVTSINPAGGYGPVDNKGHDYVFKVTFTGPPCKNTDQVFTGTIDVVGDGKVLTQKTVKLTVNSCERYSYGVKFLCGHVKETPPHVVPLTPNATLRPGVYATEVNILNYHGEPITVHKYLYPLMRQTEPLGREPRSVGRRGEDVITLPARSATFDDCARIHELLHEAPGDEPLSIYFLELVSPVPLTVTAVYTANDLRGVSVSIDVEQIEGKEIDKR
jgi:hypothetical protein